MRHPLRSSSSRRSQSSARRRIRLAARPFLESLERRDNPAALAIGASVSALPIVEILNDAGQVQRTINAFEPSYKGGVNVALGDVNGDGVPDIIAGRAKGRSEVRVFDGSTGALILDFNAFKPSYNGGVNVAFGDLNKSGYGDIIVGSASGVAVVKVFDGESGHLLSRFNAYGSGTNGVQVAAASLHGSFTSQVITAPGPGGLPIIRAFDASTGKKQYEFLAYNASYRGGIRIAAGDFNNDQVPDIVSIPIHCADPLVKVWSDGPGNILKSQFHPLSTETFVGGPSIGAVHTGDSSPDRIALTSRIEVAPIIGPGLAAAAVTTSRPIYLYDINGHYISQLNVGGLGAAAVSLSSAPATAFKSYSGLKVEGVNYVPTWPGWNSNASQQFSDSDLYGSGYQGLWGTLPSGQGRNDLATISSAGFNLVRAFNWGPTRGWNPATQGGNDHIPFLDQAQAQNEKVIVPVSNYFLSDDQFSWNNQNPDASYSFGSAPQAIQDDLQYFIRSITKNGQIHPSVYSISVGNEFDLGIMTGSNSTDKLARVIWWIKNLHDQLVSQFPNAASYPLLTAPVSNADQGAASLAKTSWFQLLVHGETSGQQTPNGAVPGGTFTRSLTGLDQYSWYTSSYVNSVNMYQTGQQLQSSLSQYDTGAPTGNAWNQQWPGERFQVPLLITELGTNRLVTTPVDANGNYIFNGSQYDEAKIADIIANDQIAIIHNFMKTSNNIVGFVGFEFTDEPNYNNTNSVTPIADAVFGAEKYYTTNDVRNFRPPAGTQMYNLNTGSSRVSFGTFPSASYPVYALTPVVTTSGKTLLARIHDILAS